MSDLQNMADLVSTGNQLLDDIRGGAISRMAHEHQTQQAEFKSEHDAKSAQFQAEHNAQMQQHDAAVASRRAAVDAVLDDLAGHTVMNIHYYDRAIHSKESLNIKPDPNDETRSEWVRVPYSGNAPYCYDNEQGLTVVHTAVCSASPPGYPDFASDKSVSRIQFVIANSRATSEQINKLFDSSDFYGAWNICAQTLRIPTINIAGLHHYQCLFVRFVNQAFNAGDTAQNIIEFGGNSKFAVDKVINYPRIAK
ncbi:hypothetical protein L3V43_20590 [Pseudoalteromonas sp. L23]|uniref:hypothetical protein n=1 Tax=unclassified Pseudoalteromonas TaxID=194690 RepID=UPI001EEFF786|nr:MULTISPECIES: hypothetical protein [unclassified Pseudoalteromonas]MCF7515977.1 hypothetical protein [Pseudoalteromonas sp. L7]MCF7528051.1 hypothetical protein [Pseudoalteromonas sp. L23]